MEEAGRPFLITGAVFELPLSEALPLVERAESRRADREAKGHFRLPSGGSAFKNNYDYGKPSGKIIDELGLCGLSVGGAQLAPWHGNLLVNTGEATAADIRALAEMVQERVFQALGLRLENEILFVGDW
jgi:UDP-N-acetylmuramate dehydrogenase